MQPLIIPQIQLFNRISRAIKMLIKILASQVVKSLVHVHQSVENRWINYRPTILRVIVVKFNSKNKNWEIKKKIGDGYSIFCKKFTLTRKKKKKIHFRSVYYIFDHVVEKIAGVNNVAIFFFLFLLQDSPSVMNLDFAILFPIWKAVRGEVSKWEAEIPFRLVQLIRLVAQYELARFIQFFYIFFFVKLQTQFFFLLPFILSNQSLNPFFFFILTLECHDLNTHQVSLKLLIFIHFNFGCATKFRWLK